MRESRPVRSAPVGPDQPTVAAARPAALRFRTRPARRRRRPRRSRKRQEHGSPTADEEVPVANEATGIVLTKQELRAVTGYAAGSAQEVLEIFERAHPADPRPREAVDAAWAFARG